MIATVVGGLVMAAVLGWADATRVPGKAQPAWVRILAAAFLAASVGWLVEVVIPEFSVVVFAAMVGLVMGALGARVRKLLLGLAVGLVVGAVFPYWIGGYGLSVVAALTVAIYRTLAVGRFTVHGLALLGLLAYVFFLRQNAVLHASRVAHAQQLRSERDSLERQVALRTTALRNLAGHHVRAREDERGRVARELHDEMGGLLTAMKLEIARLRRVPGVPPLALERVAGIEQRLNEGIAVKRRIVENLRPSSLDQLGLIPALEVLCRDTAAALGVAIDTDFSPVQLDKNAELTAYRLVQESLTNVSKYAQARHVQVHLSQSGDRVQVRVQDDGRGFDTESVPAGHHGLLGMRVRVESHAGQLQVRSAPGKGTCIEAELPASAAGNPEVTGSTHN